MSSGSSDDAPGIAQRVLLLVFLLVIIEPLGMLLYLTLTAPDALDTLVADGPGPGEVVSFLLASPDRLLVAGGLALLALLMAWRGSPGGGTHPIGAGGGGGNF